ncbi:T9SS type A sorting domain-containing protein [candidate division KSB1 bacterium]|nr:T9SS type A sorting domain-containing protein [candidate division KSB1 bacterium]
MGKKFTINGFIFTLQDLEVLMRIKSMLTILCIVLFSISGFSQTVISVEEGADENANLTAALVFANSGATDDLIIELTTDGGVYTLNASDSVTTNLTIRAKEGLLEKPTIIPGDTIDNFLEIDESLLSESITLKLQGIKFDGRFADGSLNPFDNKDMIAILRNDEADRSILPNLIIEDCDFSYSYQNGDPETDKKGTFIRVRDYGTAGTIRIENCTFMNNSDEVIVAQKGRGRDGVFSPADSLIVRNTTFINAGTGPKVQGLVTVKCDGDSATPSTKIILENLTFYNSYQQLIRSNDCDATVVRNIITASPDTTLAAKSNNIIPIEKESSSISHINAYNVAYAMEEIPEDVDSWQFILENAFEIAPGRDTGGDPGTPDTETIWNFDPMFADAENHDFTLMEGSPAYGKAHDGGALGDLRWATNATSVAKNNTSAPFDFALSQNYPNPFNPTTTIDYSLEQKSNVKIQIFDLTGAWVTTLASGQHQAGQYSVTWDASNVATGTYFYRIEIDGQSLTRKMVLLK